MFGIKDFWVYSAFVLCIASTLLCVIYGLLNWNKGLVEEEEQISEEARWELQEEKIIEKL
ncbi:MAG TPA: hypothetical protein PLZ08_03780 [Bacillota bacterium]|jgi:hypothetical protein|nr:hypothetical protein [Bacillota bacterium]HOL09236.1 hypothetical protein [Bacillota bacterium]HPO97060.1 hypothetical protein [Bacillota bacterium]